MYVKEKLTMKLDEQFRNWARKAEIRVRLKGPGYEV
jgi:hypothetical protein